MISIFKFILTFALALKIVIIVRGEPIPVNPNPIAITAGSRGGLPRNGYNSSG